MKKNNTPNVTEFTPLSETFDGLPISNNAYIKMFVVLTGNLKKQRACLNMIEALLLTHFANKDNKVTTTTEQFQKSLTKGLKMVFKNHLSKDIDWDLRHMPHQVIEKVASLCNTPTSFYKFLIKQYDMNDVRHENLTVTKHNVDNVVKSWNQH